jgi:hypothetical protein
LRVFEPPVTVEGFPLHLALHRRNEKNRAVQLMREVLKRAISLSQQKQP